MHIHDIFISEESKKNLKKGLWKNEQKKNELQKRDTSGLKKLYQNFKKYGRGPVYWPLRDRDPDSDEELDLKKYLDKKVGYLSWDREEQLYGKKTWEFGDVVKIQCQKYNNNKWRQKNPHSSYVQNSFRSTQNN